MSFEHVSYTSSAAECGALVERLTERYGGKSAQLADMRAVALRAISRGDLIPGKPTDTNLQLRRKWYRNELEARKPQAVLAAMKAEQKMDRVVSMCRALAPLQHGEMARIARAENVSYERLKDRLSGVTKSSRF